MGDKSYIRTDKGYIFYDLSSRQKSGLKLLSEQYGSIVKHSKNIIDLIEAGDYVNGKYVKEINQYKDGKSIIVLIGIIDENDIKSIVTKEQFESVGYKAESEEKQ